MIMYVDMSLTLKKMYIMYLFGLNLMFFLILCFVDFIDKEGTPL